MMIFSRPMVLVGKTKTNHGFTLLEAVMTTLLLMVGIPAIFYALSMGISADSTVESRIIAINLAQEEMEVIKDAASYADIDSYAYARTNMGGDFAHFDREVTVAGDPKEVNVNVYWTHKGDELSVNVVSLFSDYDF